MAFIVRGKYVNARCVISSTCRWWSHEAYPACSLTRHVLRGQMTVFFRPKRSPDAGPSGSYLILPAPWVRSRTLDGLLKGRYNKGIVVPTAGDHLSNIWSGHYAHCCPRLPQKDRSDLPLDLPVSQTTKDRPAEQETFALRAQYPDGACW